MSSHESTLERRLSLSVGWALVIAVLLLQWMMFSQYLRREVLWSYPAGFDQAAYLDVSYRTFDAMRSGSLLSGIWNGLTVGMPQGGLLHLEAALVYLVVGPGREGALALNFCHWMLLELATIYTLRWLTGRWSLALIALGLLMTTVDRFIAPGGMTDFRLDFAALCLYGVFLCAVVRSNLFLSVPWSVAAALAASWLILTRYLTAVSLASILGLVVVGASVAAWNRRADLPRYLAWRRRAFCASGAGLIITCITAPMLWASRSQILAYYGSHITTDEGKLRNAEFGASSLGPFLWFYPKSLAQTHLGKLFFVDVLFAFVIAVAAIIAGRRTLRESARSLPVDSKPILGFGVLALVIPATILTAFPSRSPVVAGFLVPAVIGVTLCALLAFFYRSSRLHAGRATLVATAAMSLSLGLFTEIRMAARTGPVHDARSDVRSIGEVIDLIGSESLAHGWQSPKITIDYFHEYLHPELVAPWLFERQGVLLTPSSTLGATILPIDASTALRAVATSDFVVLTDPTSRDDLRYPSNVMMRQLYPRALEIVSDGFSVAGRGVAFGQRLTLYERIALTVDGDSGGWITSSGLAVRVPIDAIAHKPVLELTGASPLSPYFLKPLAASAQLLTARGVPVTVPVQVIVTKGAYSLSLRILKDQLPPDGDVRVSISFNQFVVPRTVGINSDERELVVMTPSTVRLTSGSF